MGAQRQQAPPLPSSVLFTKDTAPQRAPFSSPPSTDRRVQIWATVFHPPQLAMRTPFHPRPRSRAPLNNCNRRTSQYTHNSSLALNSRAPLNNLQPDHGGQEAFRDQGHQHAQGRGPRIPRGCSPSSPHQAGGYAHSSRTAHITLPNFLLLNSTRYTSHHRGTLAYAVSQLHTTALLFNQQPVLRPLSLQHSPNRPRPQPLAHHLCRPRFKGGFTSCCARWPIPINALQKFFISCATVRLDQSTPSSCLASTTLP